MSLPHTLLLTDFYRLYRSRLVDSLVRLTGCRETASDLAQDAYIRLLTHPDISAIINLPAYLFEVGHNLAIDLRRSPLGRAKFVPLDEDLLCPAPTPEKLVELRQQCRILLDTILSIPPACRDVFLLRKLDELSYRQIAARLEISEKTVQRRLVQAMLHCHRSMGHLLT